MINIVLQKLQDPLSGIIPRSLSHLFDELRLLQAEFTVRVSFLELYNEEIFDLLSPTDDNTKLKYYLQYYACVCVCSSTTRRLI